MKIKAVAYLSLIYAFTLMLASCSPSDDGVNDCDCTQTTYTYDIVVVTGDSGLPVVTQVRRDLSTEVVPCQEEQTNVSLGDNTYFEILCGDNRTTWTYVCQSANPFIKKNSQGQYYIGATQVTKAQAEAACKLAENN